MRVRSARLSFEIKADGLVYLFFHGLVKLLFGFDLYLRGAAVYHALGQGVHQITALHEIIIEPLAAALFVLPALFCLLVIFKSGWSGTALCSKNAFDPVGTVGLVLALKILQNLK